MGASALQGYGFIGESRGYVFDSTLMAWIAATPGTAGGGSTQVSIREILTSSGASVMDSTASAINVNVVAGSVAGDTTATVTPAGGSTWRSQPGSTLWASSAGLHFDSTGQLLAAPLAASTSARASLTQSSTSVTAQAANASRLQWTCVNNPTQNATLYLKFGTTASTTDYDVRVPAFALYEMPPPMYTGRIDAIWDSTGAGFARTTEWVA